MSDRFQQILKLEREYQRLSKHRDELFAIEDADVSGFRLATVLASISKIEKEIGELRRRTPATA